MTTLSGWAIRVPPLPFETTFAISRRCFISDKDQPAFILQNAGQETWHSASLGEQLNELSRLVDDWDGYGAAAIEPRAIAHARSLLLNLQILPQYLLPSAAGTVLFEWEGMLGRASLELGGQTFGFFTSPSAGEPILLGGIVQELDVGDINFAVATVAGNTVPQSVESDNWRVCVSGMV